MDGFAKLNEFTIHPRILTFSFQVCLNCWLLVLLRWLLRWPPRLPVVAQRRRFLLVAYLTFPTHASLVIRSSVSTAPRAVSPLLRALAWRLVPPAAGPPAVLPRVFLLFRPCRPAAAALDSVSSLRFLFFLSAACMVCAVVRSGGSPKSVYAELYDHGDVKKQDAASNVPCMPLSRHLPQHR